MKTFPETQSILLIIAAFVAIRTWIIQAGQYDSLQYDKTESVFIITSQEGANKLPATKATFDALNIQIPMESFTSGAIYKPISIPNSSKKTAMNFKNMVNAFSQFSKAIRPLKFKTIKKRRVLNSLKFKNLVDNRFYNTNKSLENSRELLTNLKSIKKLLDEPFKD